MYLDLNSLFDIRPRWYLPILNGNIPLEGWVSTPWGIECTDGASRWRISRGFDGHMVVTRNSVEVTYGPIADVIFCEALKNSRG
jgi:hypothetical protein